MDLIIAICDDDKTHVDIIKEYINRIDIDYDVKIIEAYSGEELLELIKDKHMDIIFLDIEMRELNGIETGKKIRERYEDTIIVFLTGYKSYALEAFQIESFQYIIKPITYENFRILMQKIYLRLKEIRAYNNMNKTFSYRTRQGIVSLKYEDIYYFERQGKKTYILTQVGKYEFSGTIKSIMESLDKNIFLRCHQGFVVNTEKFLNINNNEMVLRGIEQAIPIGRKYRQDVLKALEKKLFC
ncbi:LytTR family DNA-binding domain-containing protein [Proteiniborus sp. MB09-C3]|uniref:LytR/AlgR family response regulator transcription factor n=1 Tax=Proteiniborus sp. MB09-C3 TaxID=3050072 RepID=UPI0025547AA1|nr:LytTR family DNA-binding domain-containing protein [Proteiniborus sp. MB09-C3]WIV11588.1 LytTR family DNA-binding domain-containing protein [Proteiniborus sp. MB09-C3]